MPPYTLVLCAGVSVLATLSVLPGHPEVYVIAAFGFVGLVLFLFSPRCRPPRFRALLLGTLAAALLNAGLRTHQDPGIGSRAARTARYAATLLDRVDQTDGTAEVTLALDHGPTLAARVRERAPAGSRVLV